MGGSADAALIYPLVALGSGVGMATALVAAEEWPVSRPRAWYISGGGFWLTSAAVLIANEQDLAHPTDRYPYGLIGTAVGIGVASAVSSFREITEPQALLSNESGAFGTLAGGLIQRLAAPSSAELPALGMGIGGAAGWLTAGLIGPFALTELSSSRVLFAGLGGSIGALTGAAIASPIVVNSDRREPKKEGVLFASALGGLVLGSIVGYWFSDSDPKRQRLKPTWRAEVRVQQPRTGPPRHPRARHDPGTPPGFALRAATSERYQPDPERDVVTSHVISDELHGNRLDHVLRRLFPHTPRRLLLTWLSRERSNSTVVSAAKDTWLPLVKPSR